MEPKIYTSSFRTGPDATKKQQMLFATDCAYALSEGYEFIRDSKGLLFAMLDEHNLVEVDECDECTECGTPDVTPFDPTDSYGSKQAPEFELSDTQAIDRIIHNTLHGADPITVDQAKSMFYLAQTKLALQMSAE